MGQAVGDVAGRSGQKLEIIAISRHASTGMFAHPLLWNVQSV